MKPLNVIGFLFAALLSVLGPVLAFAQSVELSEIDRSVRLHADTSLTKQSAKGLHIAAHRQGRCGPDHHQLGCS